MIYEIGFEFKFEKRETISTTLDSKQNMNKHDEHKRKPTHRDVFAMEILTLLLTTQHISTGRSDPYWL